MKRYLVELEAGEREALEAITRKGSHRSQKVVNALVLLNCDAGEFNERRATGREIAGVLRISARRVDRVKKAVCGGRSGSGAWGPAGSSSEVPSQGGRGIRGAPRRAQLRRSARGALAVVAAPAGGPRGGTRLHRERLARDGAARAKKKRRQTVAARRLGDPAAAQRRLRGGDGAGARRLPASVRCGLPGGVHGRDAAPADRRDAHARPAGTRTAGARRLRSTGASAPATCSWPPNRWPAGGQTKVTERRTKTDWARFLRDIAAQYPDATRDHAGDGQPQHAPPRRALTRPSNPPRPRRSGIASSSSTPPYTAAGSTSPRSNSTS